MSDIITDYGPDSEEERYIKSQLAELERLYRLEAEPWLKRLAAIHALKTPRMFIVPERAKKRKE